MSAESTSDHATTQPPLLFTPAGDLTVETVKNQASDILWQTVEATSVTVDLSQIDKIDSAGLQLLLLLKKDCEDNQRSLSVIQPSESVQRFWSFFKLAPEFFNLPSKSS